MPACSRRRFLRLVVAGSVGGALRRGPTAYAGQAQAVEPDAGHSDAERRIGLGFSLYGMKGLPLTDALGECAEIGYDGVELALMPGYSAEPKLLSTARRREVRDLLASLKLALPAMMDNFPPVVDEAEHGRNLDRIRAAAELAHALAPESPPLLETVLGGRPAQWDDLKGPMVERLRQWAKVAEQHDLLICVKPHVSGALHRPDDALWLLEQIDSPAIVLVYDYSHFELRGFPMEETIDRLVPKSSFIHVKDTAGDADNVRFLLPGDGRTDYVAYLRRVNAAGYRGYVVVEVSGQLHNKPDYDPRAAARRSYTALAPAFKAAGVRRPS